MISVDVAFVVRSHRCVSSVSARGAMILLLSHSGITGQNGEDQIVFGHVACCLTRPRSLDHFRANNGPLFLAAATAVTSCHFTGCYLARQRDEFKSAHPIVWSQAWNSVPYNKVYAQLTHIFNIMASSRQTNASKGGQRKPPGQRQRRRAPRPQRQQGARSNKSAVPRCPLHLLCPESSIRHVGCPAHRATPYTVIQERVVVNVATNTAEDNLLVFGPVRSSTANNFAFATNIVGVRALSGALTTAMTNIFSTKLPSATYGGRVRLRLHRLSVSVACDGNAVGAVPAGHVYMGTMNSSLDATAFTNVSDVISYLQTVNQFHGSTAKRCNSKPTLLVSHPLDKLEWQQFRTLATAAQQPASGSAFEDTLAPIGIVIKRQAAPTGIIGGDYTVNWTITCHCEWAVMFSNDPILQSTHRTHPTAPDTVWDKLSAGAQSVAGVVSSVESAATSLNGLLEAGGAIAKRFGL